jgi:hypothetical protein
MLLNTVSYAAMALPFMAQEEIIFRNSKEFLDAQKKERQQRLMGNIFRIMRSGKPLPMFAPEHRIQPQQVNNENLAV